MHICTNICSYGNLFELFVFRRPYSIIYASTGNPAICGCGHSGSISVFATMHVFHTNSVRASLVCTNACCSAVSTPCIRSCFAATSGRFPRSESPEGGSWGGLPWLSLSFPVPCATIINKLSFAWPRHTAG